MHSIYHRSACGAVQGNNTYKKTRQQTIMRRILVRSIFFRLIPVTSTRWSSPRLSLTKLQLHHCTRRAIRRARERQKEKEVSSLDDADWPGPPSTQSCVQESREREFTRPALPCKNAQALLCLLRLFRFSSDAKPASSPGCPSTAKHSASSTTSAEA